jgi:hypothetical protein
MMKNPFLVLVETKGKPVKDDKSPIDISFDSSGIKG